MRTIHSRADLKKVKRMVVKIGTKSLTGENHKLDEEKIGKFVKDVMAVKKMGKEVLIVSSGAIGAGMGRMKITNRPRKLSALQAVAAIGQGILMQTYEKYFGEQEQVVAQILLSAEDFVDAERYKNFRNTAATLLKWGVIPIINENDTVATEEIKVGDNDILSAYVAKGVKADLLVLLSDVDGVYLGDPKKPESKIIGLVERVTPRIERAVLKSSKGFGGMFTKVQAARIVTEAGIAAVIANSREKNVLERILKGEEIGTLFLPRRE
ncbi:MAG: glutamate 5-kinase [Candidatus Hadarchaeales archaeon]